MTTLLEKAHEVKHRSRSKLDFSESELIELAFAWLYGDITTKQAQTALGSKSANIANILGYVIKRGIANGTLKITKI